MEEKEAQEMIEEGHALILRGLNFVAWRAMERQRLGDEEDRSGENRFLSDTKAVLRAGVNMCQQVVREAAE